MRLCEKQTDSQKYPVYNGAENYSWIREAGLNRYKNKKTVFLCGITV